MLRRYPCTILLVGFLSTIPCRLVFASSATFDSARVQAILATQTLLFNDRFTEVDSTYRAQIAVHPDDPSAYLFRAGALFAEMSDHEENLSEKLFKELIDSVDDITARVLDTCDNAAKDDYRGFRLSRVSEDA